MFSETTNYRCTSYIIYSRSYTVNTIKKIINMVQMFKYFISFRHQPMLHIS